MSDSNLQVHCEITKEDWIRCANYGFEFRPDLRRVTYRGRWAIAFLSAVLGVYVLTFFGNEHAEHAYVWFAVAAGLAIFSGPLRRSALRKNLTIQADAHERNGLFGARRVSITPESLTEARATCAQTLNWEMVEEVKEWTDYLLFHCKGGNFVVVPKRSLGSDQHAQTFLATARNHLHTAQTKEQYGTPVVVAT